MRKSNRKKNKKMSAWKVIIIFIIFEVIFTGVTAPFLVYHGPFENVKRTLVGAAMTTLTHQWIATLFLSNEEINKILSEQSIQTIVQQPLDETSSEVVIKRKNDTNIERYDIDGKRFKGYMLVISDPTRIRVGHAEKLGKEGQLTSEIAKANNAVAAINGGGFTDESSGALWTGTGANPSGVIMSQGKVVYNDIKSENEKREVVAMTRSGRLLVGPHTIKEMKEAEVSEAVSFGPALIVNGQKAITSGDGGWGIAPRTAIGQKKDGSILFLVIDGRQPTRSIGATLKDVQDVLYEYGAYNASNLDGGSSSTMYYEGEVINNPSDSLGERAVPSILYVEER